MLLYEKVFNDLFSKIKVGYYKPSDILPSEKEMEKIYGMSRAPIRQALTKLINAGLIERKPGKGTFVVEGEVNYYKVTLGGFEKHYSNCWNNIRCKTLEVRNITPDKNISDKLVLDEGTKVTSTSRIRYLKDIPIFYLKHYSSKVDPLGIEEEGDFMSMRYVLIDKFGLNIEYVSEALMAVPANQEVSRYLNIETGSPILKVDRISYNQQYEPIAYAEYFVRSEYWDYEVVFGKDYKKEFD